MDTPIITAQSELKAFCKQISGASVIAVDTEFLRERTYFAKLCLIQIASDKGHAFIDPIEGQTLDLSPFITLWKNPDIVKVMHSPEQDIEILYHLSGEMPVSLFDTQIAAQVLGLGDSIAYNALIQILLGKTLDKTQQYTDWSRRPLNEAQQHYALADVTHLLAIYPKLVELLKQKNRLEWMNDATDALLDPRRYVSDPSECYKRVKHQLKKPEQLAALHALAAWREKRAIAKNLPRGHVLKDEVIAEIAKHLPQSGEALKSLRLLKPIKDDAFAATLVGVIQDALAADPETYPTRPMKPEITANMELVGLLSLLLKQRCREENIASRLIATRSELEQLAVGKKELPCLQGWRYEIFGRYAEDLMAGKLRFHWDQGGQQVVMDDV